MPIFKIRIAVKTEYISSIFVEAHDLSSALSYTMQNDEWHDDGHLVDSEDNYCLTKTPLFGHEIKDIEEVAREYIPYNGDRTRTLGEIANGK